MSPARDDASFIRPRLFDHDDEKEPDNVGTILTALQDSLEDAVQQGNTAEVARIQDSKRRILDAADDEYYYSEFGPGTEKAGAAEAVE